MAPAGWRKATRPPGAWIPGSRVYDDSCAFSVGFISGLLEADDVLEAEERWCPTRWLMKAVWEVLHKSNSPMSQLISGVRSSWDNEAFMLDLYRKLTGDFNSSAEELHGTGERAHGRCARSYVFSSQLRHWLHEIPTFVSLPSGWQPPSTDKPPPASYTGPAAQAASIGSARRPGGGKGATPPMVGGGDSALDTEGGGRFDASTRAPAGDEPDQYTRDHGGSGEDEGRTPRRGDDEGRTPGRGRSSPGRRGEASGGPPRVRPAHLPAERPRPPATVPQVRVLPERPARRARGRGRAEEYGERRGLYLIAELADALRKRMHDDLTRPADLWRKWDRDEDGVISVDELMAGVAQLGLAPGGADEEELYDAVEAEVHAATGNRDGVIDFAMLASWLDPHSSFRRKSLEETAGPAVASGGSSAAFGSSARYDSGHHNGDPWVDSLRGGEYDSGWDTWQDGRGGGGEWRGGEARGGDLWREVSGTMHVGSLGLEVHHFLPCQALQRDDSVRWLQVCPAHLPPHTTPTRLHPRSRSCPPTGVPALSAAPVHAPTGRDGLSRAVPPAARHSASAQGGGAEGRVARAAAGVGAARQRQLGVARPGADERHPARGGGEPAPRRVALGRPPGHRQPQPLRDALAGRRPPPGRPAAHGRRQRPALQAAWPAHGLALRAPHARPRRQRRCAAAHSRHAPPCRLSRWHAPRTRWSL